MLAPNKIVAACPQTRLDAPNRPSNSHGKMVQYIITPWRNRRELFNVRRAFYPSSEIGEAISNERRHEAVEMVSVWVQRGNCPHSVESTALLVSAMLNETVGASAYAIRAAYSAAFSR